MVIRLQTVSFSTYVLDQHCWMCIASDNIKIMVAFGVTIVNPCVNIIGQPAYVQNSTILALTSRVEGQFGMLTYLLGQRGWIAECMRIDGTLDSGTYDSLLPQTIHNAILFATYYGHQLRIFSLESG
jgi:hypothetical protein